MGSIPDAAGHFDAATTGRANFKRLEMLLRQLQQAITHGGVGANRQAAQATLEIEEDRTLDVHVWDIPRDAELDDYDLEGTHTLFRAKFVLAGGGNIVQVRGPNRWAPDQGAQCLKTVEQMVLGGLIDWDRQRVDAHLRILRMQLGAFRHIDP